MFPEGKIGADFISDLSVRSCVLLFILSALTSAGVQLVIKYPILLNDVIYLDDITYYYYYLIYNSYMGFSILKWPYVFVPNLLITLTGSIISIRIIYVIMLALTTGLLSVLLYVVTRSFSFSYILALAAFISPFSFIVITSVLACYNLTFIFLFLISVILAVFSVVTNPDNPIIIISLAVLSALLAFLAAFTTSNGLLIPPLLLIALSVFLFPALRKKHYIILICSFLIMCVVFYIVYMISFSHPYTSMLGRVTYRPVDVLLNYLSHISSLTNQYINPFIFTGRSLHTSHMPSYAWGISLHLLILIGLATLIYKEGRLSLASLAIASAYLIATLAIIPLSALNRAHTWYYFLPGVFLIVTVGLICWELNRVLGYLAATILLVAGIHSNFRQLPYYIAEADAQATLRGFILSNELNWSKGDQVILITDRFSGFGLRTGRSNQFLSIVTKQKPGIIDFEIKGTSSLETKEFCETLPAGQRHTYLWKKSQKMPSSIDDIC